MNDKPFSTNRFQVDAKTYQRFCVGFLLRRYLPWLLVYAAAAVGVGFIDLRWTIVAVILAAALLPMVWIMWLASFLKIVANRRNMLPMAITGYTPRCKIEMLRWPQPYGLPDDSDEPTPERVVIADPTLRAKVSGRFVVVEGRDLLLLVPAKEISSKC